MANNILIKPLITEKSQLLTNAGKYTFIVNKKANKIEIGRAIEKMYNVNVLSVNTTVLPAKLVNRNSRSGVIKGVKPSFKKAVIQLADGESLDIFDTNAE